MGRGLRLYPSSVTYCVTFGKLLNFSRPTDSYLIGLLGDLKGLTCAKCPGPGWKLNGFHPFQSCPSLGAKCPSEASLAIALLTFGYK